LTTLDESGRAVNAAYLSGVKFHHKNMKRE
jgi:hypothetical protein